MSFVTDNRAVRSLSNLFVELNEDPIIDQSGKMRVDHLIRLQAPRVGPEILGRTAVTFEIFLFCTFQQVLNNRIENIVRTKQYFNTQYPLQ